MEGVGEYRRQRNNLAGNGHAFDQTGVIHQRVSAGSPGDRKKVIGHQAAHDEQREMRVRIVGENLSEDERQYSHEHQRIQHGPQESQRHIPVTDLEVLSNQVGKQKENVSVPRWPMPASCGRVWGRVAIIDATHYRQFRGFHLFTHRYQSLSGADEEKGTQSIPRYVKWLISSRVEVIENTPL